MKQESKTEEMRAEFEQWAGKVGGTTPQERARVQALRELARDMKAGKL